MGLFFELLLKYYNFACLYFDWIWIWYEWYTLFLSWWIVATLLVLLILLGQLSGCYLIVCLSWN